MHIEYLGFKNRNHSLSAIQFEIALKFGIKVDSFELPESSH